MASKPTMICQTPTNLTRRKRRRSNLAKRGRRHLRMLNSWRTTSLNSKLRLLMRMASRSLVEATTERQEDSKLRTDPRKMILTSRLFATTTTREAIPLLL